MGRAGVWRASPGPGVGVGAFPAASRPDAYWQESQTPEPRELHEHEALVLSSFLFLEQPLVPRGLQGRGSALSLTKVLAD